MAGATPNANSNRANTVGAFFFGLIFIALIGYVVVWVDCLEPGKLRIIGIVCALLAGLMQRACDEGHRALRASVLAANGRSIAMLRRAGFSGRGGAGTLREYELALGSS